MTFGIAIPTYKNHLGFLVRLLDSIENSTEKPDVVSVSISSVNLFELEKEYSFKLILTITSEYKNPSQNRNIAASKLNTDIISFIDGDDISQKKRVEFIKTVFKNEPTVMAVVHNFEYTNTGNLEGINNSDFELDYDVDFLNTINQETLFPLHNNVGGDYNYQNAHVSVRKEIFEKFKYDEDENKKYYEDSLYNRILVKNNILITRIKNKLSYYIK